MSKQRIYNKYCFIRKDCKFCDTCWTNNIFNAVELMKIRSVFRMRLINGFDIQNSLDIYNKCSFILGELQFDTYEDFKKYDDLLLF